MQEENSLPLKNRYLTHLLNYDCQMKTLEAMFDAFKIQETEATCDLWDGLKGIVSNIRKEARAADECADQAESLFRVIKTVHAA